MCEMVVTFRSFQGEILERFLVLAILIQWNKKYSFCKTLIGISSLQEDQFGRLLPTFIQIINFTEQEEAQYRKVVSAVLEGEEVTSISLETGTSSHRALSFDNGINNKVDSFFSGKVQFG